MAMQATLLLPSTHCRLSFAGSPTGALSLWSELDDRTDHVFAAFTAPEGWRGDRSWRAIDATSRFKWPEGARRVAVIGLLSLSSLAPLILWDLVNGAPEGAEVVLIDQPAVLADNVLTRGFYRPWMVEDANGGRGSSRAFRKSGPSPIEAEAGLDAWSFCLPMGRPNHSTLVNIIDRVGGLQLAYAQILIACPPQYADLLPKGVVHVPMDSGATLTAKKNALVEAASTPNVCIFHDRLLPPRNFRTAVEQFGDLFPITGFQNLMIEPDDCTIRRYSDYHSEIGPGFGQIAVFDGCRQDPSALYGEHLDLRQFWSTDFVEASVTEYDETCYVTGSLYMTKRSAWLHARQDSTIDWGRLEDVEFGHRCIREMGIPMRINPFGFARSARVRPAAEPMRRRSSIDLTIADARPVQAKLGSRTPVDVAVLPISEQDYRGNLLLFAQRWVGPHNLPEARRLIAAASLSDVADVAQVISALLHLSTVRRAAGEIESFIHDVAAKLAVSAPDPATVSLIKRKTLQGGPLVREVLRSPFLAHTLAAGVDRPLFQRHGLCETDLLNGNLVDVWRDDRHGVFFAGEFEAFVGAVRAAL